ncbi:MAG TPA: hypothetical protein VFZ54_07120 [Burkholderiales bacterium]
MLVIVGVDIVCGRELSPWIAYIVPVALASRYCSLGVGAAYAILAGLLLCVAARHTGHPYSGDAYFLAAAASQTLVLLVIAWLISRLSALERLLRQLVQEQAAPSTDRPGT